MMKFWTRKPEVVLWCEHKKNDAPRIRYIYVMEAKYAAIKMRGFSSSLGIFCTIDTKIYWGTTSSILSHSCIKMYYYVQK